MSIIAVLTDSTASLPEAILNNLNIKTVAYYIHRGYEVLRDLVTIQREEFLRWMVTARFTPTTACKIRAIKLPSTIPFYFRTLFMVLFQRILGEYTPN